MNACELAEKLNSIAQYELRETGSGYESYRDLVKADAHYGGEWVKVEDVAKALGLTIEYNQDYGKFLP